MDAFLSRCDILSLHAPSTAETRGMVDAALINQLPQAAILVNTARGDLIVDDDVIAALSCGRLAAIGLDVFANEPNLDSRYPLLDNAFVLPHIGSATLETREAMGELVLQGLSAHL